MVVALAGDGITAAPVIEIEFPGDARVRIPASVSPAVAAAVVCGLGAAMIPIPSGVRVWLAVGRTDMRKGMNGLALQVQQVLGRDSHAGDLYVFRGARSDLIEIVPDYAWSSANLRSRYGIGGVRTASKPRRGIMAARSYRRLKRYSNSAR